MKILPFIPITFVLAACATSKGLNREGLRGRLSENKTVTEDEIKNIYKLKPQLRKPFKLALYFEDSQTTKQQKEIFSDIGAELKSRGIVSEITFIDDSIIEGNNEQRHGKLAIRVAAARTGADAVLIIKDATDVETYNNPLGATYFLIAPYFFIPGSVVDSLSLAKASLWDVRNQYLYFSTTAEGTASETRPGMFIENDRVRRKSKVEALKALKLELSKEIEKLSSK